MTESVVVACSESESASEPGWSALVAIGAALQELSNCLANDIFTDAPECAESVEGVEEARSELERAVVHAQQLCRNENVRVCTSLPSTESLDATMLALSLRHHRVRFVREYCACRLASLNAPDALLEANPKWLAALVSDAGRTFDLLAAASPVFE